MLETYVQSSEEKILKVVRRKGVENQETASCFKEKRRTENTQGWKDMGNLRDRAKIKETMKHGLDKMKESLSNKQ